jgi:peroxiredoxin Q/BCP
MVAPGQKLDLRFTVKVVHDGVVKQVTFADLLTRRTIVSVYMKNQTGTCDRQNESLVAHAAQIDRAGCNLIAVSRDTGGSHLRYAAAKKIRYVLVSDPNDQFARATDSLVQKSMYGRTFLGPTRAAYLLDPNGTVLAIIPKVDAENHATQILDLIHDVQGIDGTRR